MKLHLLFAFTAVLLSSAANAQNAFQEAEQIQLDSLKRFHNKDFQALNDQADHYLDSKARLQDGRWKLSFLFFGLEKPINGYGPVDWQEKIEIAEEWLEATPEHAAPYIALSQMITRLAWVIRGNGYARDVHPANMEQFLIRLQHAQQTIENGGMKSIRHPLGLYQLAILAKGLNWPQKEFEELEHLASLHHPDYYLFYFRAADYYLPQWHGSNQAIRDFADKATNQSKALEGMTLYARIAWSQTDAVLGHPYQDNYFDWGKVKQGFEDMMANYPNSNWNLNAYAYHACIAEDWKTAHPLITKLKGNIHPSIWINSRYADDCINKTRPPTRRELAR